jgi:hypothetical protein
MIIQAEVHIRAPLPVVWRVFSHLEDWKDWNTACNSCRLVEGNELAAGSCLAFVVKPIVFPVKVQPRVVSCEPGREVVWEGAGAGPPGRRPQKAAPPDGPDARPDQAAFRGLRRHPAAGGNARAAAPLMTYEEVAS